MNELSLLELMAPIEKIKELYSVWALTYDKVAIRACISEFSLQFSNFVICCTGMQNRS